MFPGAVCLSGDTAITVLDYLGTCALRDGLCWMRTKSLNPDMTSKAQENAASETPVSDLLGALRGSSRSGDQVSIAAIVESLGTASLSAVMLVPALVVVTPLSGIPGLSSVCGILIALVAAQRVIGKRHLWLPEWLLSRRIEREKLVSTISWLEKPAYWIDRLTQRRLSALVHKPFSTLMALICMLCGLAMPVLELVPFSSSILGSAVSLVAIALVAKDGAVGFLALLIMGGLAAVTVNVL